MVELTLVGQHSHIEGDVFEVTDHNSSVEGDVTVQESRHVSEDFTLVREGRYQLHILTYNTLQMKREPSELHAFWVSSGFLCF